MKKHVLALLLAVALIVGMIPTVAMATDEPVNPYKSASLTLTGKPTLVLTPKTDVVGGNIADYTTVVDGKQYSATDGVFEIEVTAARLYTPINATLMNGDTEIGSCEFVLVDYAEKAKAIDPAASELLDSLIAYSNYAAVYNGATSSATFQAVDKITATADTTPGVTVLSGYNSVVVKSEVSGIGVVPVLNDACDLYFTFPDSITGYTVKINGTVVTPVKNNNTVTAKYYHAVTEILPQNWADPFVVEVYEGETLKTQFSYSVLSYVQRKLSADNETLTNLLKAMYIYYRDAEMYARTEAREAVENFANLDAWTLPTATGTTPPTINAAGQLEFAVTSGKNGNIVTKAISSTSNVNSNVTVIDLDFKGPTNSTPVEISVGPSGQSTTYVLRTIVNANQLRHVQSGSTATAANAASGYSLPINAMHHARIILDMTTQKYDMYIDGIKWITGAGVMNSFDYNDALELRIGMFATGVGTIYFDNVKVSKLNGLEKTLYETTFENLDTVNDYSWSSAGTVGVSDNTLLLQNNANTMALAALIPGSGLTGKFVYEISVSSSALSASTGTTPTGVVIKLGRHHTTASERIEDCVNLKILSDCVQYTTPDGVKTVSMKFVKDTFYRVKFIVDVDTNTYDIYIDDQDVAKNVAFNIPTTASVEVTSLNRIRLTATRKAAWNIKFDNMEITQLLSEI